MIAGDVQQQYVMVVGGERELSVEEVDIFVGQVEVVALHPEQTSHWQFSCRKRVGGRLVLHGVAATACPNVGDPLQIHNGLRGAVGADGSVSEAEAAAHTGTRGRVDRTFRVHIDR